MKIMLKHPKAEVPSGWEHQADRTCNWDECPAGHFYIVDPDTFIHVRDGVRWAFWEHNNGRITFEPNNAYPEERHR